MTKIQVRRGPSVDWQTANPVLSSGEIGLDTLLKDIKIGDGTTEWKSLPFYNTKDGVFIKDFLAPNRVPGTTDDLPAFNAAIATGKRVYDDGGMYHLSNTPNWGSNSFFQGAGKGRTIIKLLDSAVVYADLWSNVNFTTTTAINGYFADFTLDGNCQRQGGLTGAGGSRSSTLALRNVKGFIVERVSSINAVQHGFDVTRGAYDYPYGGDGVLATLRSDDVKFVQCDASNFGDDAFTCHSSDNIEYTSCLGFNPRLLQNCNAFEIDGDSAHVTLTANRSFNCYAGIEIKGHKDESAGQDVIINGHRDVGSVRSYNFRHIDHHSGTDVNSVSARNILASNLVSIYPNNDRGFQDDATPRALAISAYIGVSIHGFTAIGRPGTYGSGDVAIAIQYRAKDIVLSGLNISGWTGADQDLSITSGDNVSVFGLTVRDSAQRAVYTGSTVTSIQIFGVQATGPTAGSVAAGIDIYTSTGVDLQGINAIVGYGKEVRADSIDYATVEAFLRRTRGLPAGVTRLIDLPPYHNYYITTSDWATLTDIPAGTSGGHWVNHSNMTTDSVIQTVTRNTSTQWLQESFWRVENYVAKSAGIWNSHSIPVLGVGTAPPAGTPVGSVYFVKTT